MMEDCAIALHIVTTAGGSAEKEIIADKRSEYERTAGR